MDYRKAKVKSMKELTRVTTVQLTEILRVDDEMAARLQGTDDAYKAYLSGVMRKRLGVDDVVVTNVQDFIREE